MSLDYCSAHVLSLTYICMSLCSLYPSLSIELERISTEALGLRAIEYIERRHRRVYCTRSFCMFKLIVSFTPWPLRRISLGGKCLSRPYSHNKGMGTYIRVNCDNTVQNTTAQSIIYINIEVIVSLSDVCDVYDEGGITIPVVLLN